MFSLLHQKERFSKLDEVEALLRLEGMLEEERNDDFHEVAPVTHAIGHSVAVILSNHATSEVRLERVQDLDVTFVLNNGEFRKNLNPGCHLRMNCNPNMKAAFSVYEASDPSCIKIHRRT